MRIALFLIVVSIRISFAQIAPDTSKLRKTEFDDPRERGRFENRLFRLGNDTKNETIEKGEFLFEYKNLNMLQGLPMVANPPSTVNPMRWVELGPTNVGGRTRHLEMQRVSADKLTVWACAITGGLWKNENILDPNESWYSMNDYFDNFVISTLSIDPANAQHICLGTGEGPLQFTGYYRGNGIFESFDGGASWSRITPSQAPGGTYTSPGGFNDFVYVNEIIICEDGTLIAATQAGLFLKKQNATKWQSPANTILNSLPIYDLERCSNADLYAGVQGAVFKSLDNGQTWTALNIPLTSVSRFNRIKIASAPADPATVFAILEQGNFVFSIVRSVDGGAHWLPVSKPSFIEYPNTGIAWYSMCISVSPFNKDEVVIGSVRLAKTLDGGRNWFLLTEDQPTDYWYVHPDQHVIKYDEQDPNIILVANDGGVYLSANATQRYPKFNPANLNYNVTQFNSIAISQTSDMAISGAQDNGTQRFTSIQKGPTARVTDAGDSGYGFIDATNPATQMTSYIGNYFYFTNNNWATHQYLALGTNQCPGKFVNPADYDSKNKLLYTVACSNTITRISAPNATVQYTISMPSYAHDEETSFLKLSEKDEGTLYVATNFGRVFRITNAHTGNPSVPSDISFNLPRGSISCIDVQLTSSAESIMVSYLNSVNNSKVWLTTLVNSSVVNWTNISGDIDKEIPVRWVIQGPTGFRYSAILGTEIGIITTTKYNGASTKWFTNTVGMGHVRVDMIRYRQSDNTFWVATYGRGAFRSALQNEEPSPLAIMITNVKNLNKTFDGVRTNHELDKDYVQVRSEKDLANYTINVINKNTNKTKHIELKGNEAIIDLESLGSGEKLIKIKKKPIH